MKIKEVTDEEIIFDNNNTIYFNHEIDCCEENYADFSILNKNNVNYNFNFDEYTTPFLEKNLIRKIWFYDLVINAIDKVDRYMEDVDYEFEDKLDIDKKE